MRKPEFFQLGVTSDFGKTYPAVFIDDALSFDIHSSTLFRGARSMLLVLKGSIASSQVYLIESPIEDYSNYWIPTNRGTYPFDRLSQENRDAYVYIEGFLRQHWEEVAVCGRGLGTARVQCREKIVSGSIPGKQYRMIYSNNDTILWDIRRLKKGLIIGRLLTESVGSSAIEFPEFSYVSAANAPIWMRKLYAELKGEAYKLHSEDITVCSMNDFTNMGLW